MRRRLVPLLLAAAACGGGPPIPEADVLLRVTAGVAEVELGRAFPLTVVRVWNRDDEPSPWRDAALAPLVLQPLGVTQRDDGRRIEETRRFRAFAFSLSDVSVPAAVFVARPRNGGPERTAQAEPLRIRVNRALDPAAPGEAELPGPPLHVPLPWRTWTATAVAALVAVAVLLVRRMRRRRPAIDTETAPPAVPPPPTSAEIALGRIAGLRSRGGGGDEVFHVEASSIVREYAGARFGLRTAEMTTEQIVGALADRRDSLRAVLAKCDLVKFAALQTSAPERTELLDAAERFVRATGGSAAA